jgi:hypothetical protein
MSEGNGIEIDRTGMRTRVDEGEWHHYERLEK